MKYAEATLLVLLLLVFLAALTTLVPKISDQILQVLP